MSDLQPGAGNPFDRDQLLSLIQLMQEHELTELELKSSKGKIRLARGGVALSAAPVQQAPPPSQEEKPPPVDPANIVLIKSPMVGTFFSRPNPDSDPYVKVGDNIEPETPVCLIEAMKTYNPIPAEVRGKIVAVLVKNEEAVAYGTPLFKVDTSG